MRLPVLFCISLSMVATSWGQQFELVEPSGQVAATVQVERGGLRFSDRSGERRFYGREQRYDSGDGLFAGYFNLELNRALRFPRSGQGKMQVVDFDDRSPRFRYSQQAVRRRGSNNRPVVVAPPPAIGYPGYGFGFPVPGIGYPGFGPIGPVNPGGPFYSLYSQPPIIGYRYPQSVLIESNIQPNPALADVQVQLFNGGPREIQVGVVDVRNPAPTRSMRIQPRTGVEIEVQRDPGGQRIDRYQTITPLGDTITKEIVRPIPPAVRYEIVVHEWAMQSIAIDRTGKSPNVIEDINFQGKGLGRFPLPPGDQLQSGTIDVYRAAIDSGNQGTVGPIVAEEDPSSGPSPLERAILEAQQRAQGNSQPK